VIKLVKRQHWTATKLMSNVAHNNHMT